MSPSSTPLLLIGTHNPNKVDRWTAALPGIRVVSPEQLGVCLTVPEGLVSCEKNALSKARSYASASGVVTLGEDAGLRIRSLDGAPGAAVRRWGGAFETDLSDSDLLAQLMTALDGVSDTDAVFEVAVAVVSPDGFEWSETIESPGYFDLGRAGRPGPKGNPLSTLFVSRETGKAWSEMAHLSERPAFSRAFVERVRRAVNQACS